MNAFINGFIAGVVISFICFMILMLGIKIGKGM